MNKNELLKVYLVQYFGLRSLRVFRSQITNNFSFQGLVKGSRCRNRKHHHQVLAVYTDQALKKVSFRAKKIKTIESYWPQFSNFSKEHSRLFNRVVSSGKFAFWSADVCNWPFHML